MRTIAEQSAHGRGCRTPAMSRARGGFSLVELLTVLAILGVVAALAAPRFGRSSARYRAELAARKIAADLEHASAYARAHSTSVEFACKVTGSRYTIGSMPDPVTGSAGTTVRLEDEPWRATILSALFGTEDRVTFDALGLPSSTGTIIVRAGSFRAAVTLEASGRASASALSAIDVEILVTPPTEEDLEEK